MPKGLEISFILLLPDHLWFFHPFMGLLYKDFWRVRSRHLQGQFHVRFTAREFLSKQIHNSKLSLHWHWHLYLLWLFRPVFIWISVKHSSHHLNSHRSLIHRN